MKGKKTKKEKVQATEVTANLPVPEKLSFTIDENTPGASCALVHASIVFDMFGDADLAKNALDIARAIREKQVGPEEADTTTSGN